MREVDFPLNNKQQQQWSSKVTPRRKDDTPIQLSKKTEAKLVLVTKSQGVLSSPLVCKRHTIPDH